LSLKYGFSFNLRMLKENNPELWGRYKDYFGNIQFEDEEKVYFHDLPDGKKAFEFLRELIPDELKKEFEKGL
jgi:hypothetical protein